MRGKTQFGFQVQFGNEEIDLSFIEQLGEFSQTRYNLFFSLQLNQASVDVMLFFTFTQDY